MTNYDLPYVSPFHTAEECHGEGHENCIDMTPTPGAPIFPCPGSSLCDCGEQETTDD